MTARLVRRVFTGDLTAAPPADATRTDGAYLELSKTDKPPRAARGVLPLNCQSVQSKAAAWRRGGRNHDATSPAPGQRTGRPPMALLPPSGSEAAGEL
jgi:hypothetical protein